MPADGVVSCATVAIDGRSPLPRPPSSLLQGESRGNDILYAACKQTYAAVIMKLFSRRFDACRISCRGMMRDWAAATVSKRLAFGI
jgi:hypothetical protein